MCKKMKILFTELKTNIFLTEYYEEVFALINECTTAQISPIMWNMLFLVMETFSNDASDYFTGKNIVMVDYVFLISSQ